MQRLEVEPVGLQHRHLLRIIADDGNRDGLVEVDEARLVEELCLRTGLHLQPLVKRVLVEVLARDGLAIVVALDLLAADLTQEVALLLCLRALGQRVDVEVLGHADEGLEDLAALLRERMQELHVELYRVEVVVLEHIERGIATAEIVEQHGIAPLLEAADTVKYRLHFVDECVLRDLDLQEAERQVVFLADGLCRGKRVLQDEIEAREVDRDGQRRQAIVEVLARHLGDGVEDVGVELVDEVGLLEHGDEDSRRDHAVLRRLPARERLRTDELARQCADDGLQVEADEAFLERLVQVLAHVVLHLVAQAELLRVDGPVARGILLDGVAGNLGLAVERDIEVLQRTWSREEADARLQRDVWVADIGLHALAGLVDARLHIGLLRQDREVVRAEVDDRTLREHILQDALDVLQAEVALPEAMRGVVEMEIRDIKENRAGLEQTVLPPLPLQDVRRIPQEFLPALLSSSHSRVTASLSCLTVHVFVRS